MKAKIKGEWIEYDYAIDTLLSTKDMVMQGVQKNTGKAIRFLGRSKAIQYPDGAVKQLKKRCMFFRFEE